MSSSCDFDNVLRLIYINRIKTRYLDLDFVTMRTGGASTSGLQSHRRIISDHYHAFKKHGLISGYLLDFVRYPFKLLELASSKLLPSHSHSPKQKPN
ncbi:MAG: hypothetical protein K2K97_10450 [Muribaculaceae bacterium]|nr:hypothetical protein [Muribaculaceae bacterium]